MEIVAFTLIIIGALIAFVFGIQLIIEAFNQSVWWGLGYLFVPFVALIFLICHWDVAKKPFLRGLLAIPFYIVGFILMPTGY